MSDQETAPPPVGTEIVQLLGTRSSSGSRCRCTNRSRSPLVVDRMRVDIPGFARTAAVPKDSPIAGGLTVNLPWAYGAVACTETSAPDVGRPSSTFGCTPRPDLSRSPCACAGGPQHLLQRIADRTCTVERIGREVSLRLRDDWRLAREHGRKELQGTLSVDLLGDQPRDVSQVAGTVMYGLEPDEQIRQSAEAAGEPDAGAAAATCRPVRPTRSMRRRHAEGEIKKPLDFLVWVGAPGDDEPVAVNPRGRRLPDADALRQVCAF